jgi:putative transcriptional regulator
MGDDDNQVRKRADRKPGAGGGACRRRRVKRVRVTKVEVPDVRAIRRALRMSQHRFAAAYRIPLPTLKNWEQGRRAPDAPAMAYLLAIKRRPNEIMEAVA